MSMERLNVDDYMLHVARLVSLRGTCVRRTVGCVLTDEHHRILATGYNGGLPGEPHCLDHECAGANDAKGNLSRCEAVHAEANAVVHCTQRDRIVFAYCTDSPCAECGKLLAMLPRLQRLHYVRWYTEEGMAALKRNSKLLMVSHVGLYQQPMSKVVELYERDR